MLQFFSFSILRARYAMAPYARLDARQVRGLGPCPPDPDPLLASNTLEVRLDDKEPLKDGVMLGQDVLYP